MGRIALFLLLLADFSLVLYLRGMPIGDYLASRDPISGTVYYAELGLLAVILYLIGRGRVGTMLQASATPRFWLDLAGAGL
jgi:hypothetical protein